MPQIFSLYNFNSFIIAFPYNNNFQIHKHEVRKCNYKTIEIVKRENLRH
jgi:hypothetical protein